MAPMKKLILLSLFFINSSLFAQDASKRSEYYTELEALRTNVGRTYVGNLSNGYKLALKISTDDAEDHFIFHII